jgi:hypothetical protein
MNGPPDGVAGAGWKQVPYGNGRQKSKSNGKSNSRFPSGMEEKQQQRQEQQQIPFGNGRKKSEGNGIRSAG